MRFFCTIPIFCFFIKVAFAEDCNLKNNLSALINYNYQAANLNLNTNLTNKSKITLKCNQDYFIPDTNSYSIQLSCDNGTILVNDQKIPVPPCRKKVCLASNAVSLIQNVRNYPMQDLNFRDKFTFYCLSNHAIQQDGQYITAVETECDLDGKLKPTNINNFENCQRFCNVSDLILNRNIDVNMSSYKEKEGGEKKPLTSSFVPKTSILNLKCKENFSFSVANTDGESVDKTEYKYNCNLDSKENKELYSCKPNRLSSLPNQPPISNTPNGTVLNIPCFASSLITVNSKISKVNNKDIQGTINNTFANKDQITLKCNQGFALQNRLKEFTVSCNGSSGSWQNIQPCIQVCDARYLKKGENLESVLIEKENNTTIIPTNNVIYKNENVIVNCKSGYEVRNNNNPFYKTTCLDGKNFSVGTNPPKCETIIPKCENSEITVIGTLKDNKLKNKTTIAGGLVPFVCLGDQNQQGEYFKNGGNNGGIKDVPVCTFNEETGESQWSHKTFKCFDGCINGSLKLNPKQAKYTKIKQKIDRVYQLASYGDIYQCKNVITTNTFASDDSVIPSNLLWTIRNSRCTVGDNDWNYHRARQAILHSVLFNKDNIDYQWQVSDLDLVERALKSKPRNSCSSDGTGYMVFNDYNIKYCPSQASLKSYTSMYRIFLFSIIHYKTIKTRPPATNNAGPIALISIDYSQSDGYGDCIKSSGSHFKNRSKNNCEKGLKRLLSKSSVFMLNGQTFNNIQYEEDLLKQTFLNIQNNNDNNIKNIFDSDCQGFANLDLANCSNQYTVALNAEIALLENTDTKKVEYKMVRNAWRSGYAPPSSRYSYYNAPFKDIKEECNLTRYPEIINK